MPLSYSAKTSSEINNVSSYVSNTSTVYPNAVARGLQQNKKKISMILETFVKAISFVL